jgi:hypothetical protein
MFVTPPVGNGVTDDFLKKAIRQPPSLSQPGKTSLNLQNNSLFSDCWLNGVMSKQEAAKFIATAKDGEASQIDEKELAKQLLRNCNYLKSSKRDMSLMMQRQNTS